MVTLDDIRIRTELLPGDLGYVLYLHGSIYGKENDYGRPFEVYVAEGLLEFARRYDSSMDRVWVCEHDGVIMGFMLLMHRENNEAQLRYFLIHPDYRGIGLGKKLMELFRQFASQRNYGGVYLWTTNEQKTAISLYLRYGFRLTEEKASTTFGKTTIEQRYDLILR